MQKIIISVLAVLVVVEGMFLTKAYNKINQIDDINYSFAISNNTESLLQLEDRIWPELAFVNGPTHKEVFGFISAMHRRYGSSSCEENREVLSNNSCRLAFWDSIKNIYPTLLSDDDISTDVMLTDKHLEEAFKDIILSPNRFADSDCSTDYGRKRILEDQKRTEKFCYKQCRRHHSKAECQGRIIH